MAPAAHAHGYPVHTVTPGESLSSIAAANGMQIARLAAANGLAWDSLVVAGQSLQVPPADGAYTSTTGQTMGYATSTTPISASTSPAATGTSSPGSSSASSTGSASSGSSSGSSGSGAYVRPGDTLSAIAARLGVSQSALAAANGIANYNLVLSGTTLKSPGATTTVTPAPAAVPSTSRVSSSTGPEGQAAVTGSGASPTAERLSSSQISSIAAQHGVPGSLAAAIAWQESGNNNAMVSSAGARGVMQIMPGTWDWINTSLAKPPLNRASAHDNVRAGSLFLKQLLSQTGGDEATAIAGYYQGLGSVRERGLYDDTKQYVQNVQALRGRLGG